MSKLWQSLNNFLVSSVNSVWAVDTPISARMCWKIFGLVVIALVLLVSSFFQSLTSLIVK